jgi:NHLM bacteriocin system ABC transporter peptidase/ATP-binding protein
VSTAEATAPEEQAPPPNGHFSKRAKTPSVIQMEAVECGAASLAMILAYHGRWEPLERLRSVCGVSRDGSKAGNIMRGARSYGLEAQGYKKEPDDLRTMQMPMIIHWNFNHFVVLEGMDKKYVYLNDPARGPRRISHEEFDQSFTGVALSFSPTETFEKGGEKFDLIDSLKTRLSSSRAAIVFTVIAGLMLVIPGLVIPTFTRIFVDDVLVGGRRTMMLPILLGLVLAGGMRAVLTWIQRHYLLRLQTKLSLSAASRFLWHVLRLPVEFFTQRQAGDIARRIALNDSVAQTFSTQLATVLINGVTVIFYAFLMFTYDWVLTVIGIVMVLLNLFALRWMLANRALTSQKLQQDQGKLQGTTVGGLQMIETLKATGGESDFYSRWAGYQANSVNAQSELSISTALLNGVPALLASINTAVILFIGGFRVIDGALSVGTLIAFQSLMASFMGPVQQMVSIGSVFQQTEGSLKRLDDVLKNPEDSELAAAENIPLGDGPSKLQGYLELKDVTFGYSSVAEPLFENFNLKLTPGSRVAIVGGSGSGKSTIAKLVTGLYQPWSGEILFDGLRKDQIPRDVLTNSLAMVDQDILMFQGTIKSNLTLWDPTLPEAAVFLAAKDAAIHEDIAKRPGGYDAAVEEGGRNFSGGQRQRMEIARALVTEPRLLVLDEATSALDPVTEQAIDLNIRRRGCTCMIVAHRLSTIRDCDEIVVLERGKVVERGSHDELLALDGTYARLIKAGESE